MQSRFFIATAAGIVSGLLFMAATRGHVVSLMGLVFLTPLPISIVGFSWGWILSAIAAATAFGFLTLTGSLIAGLFHLLLFGLPATGAVYLLLLNRGSVTISGREDVEWYPVGHVLFWIALGSGGVALAALMSVGSSTADLQAHVTKVVESMLLADMPWFDNKKMGPDGKQKFIQLLTTSFSGAIAMTWMWITIFNLWIGAKVARASGLLLRPWPNVSLTALPAWAGFAVAASMGLSFLDDYPGHIASGFASGIFLAFILVGLAIIHNITWKSPIRPALLFGVYIFLAVFNPLSSLAIATVALIEPFLPLRNPYNGGHMSNQPPDEHDT
jgi:Predicted membrane protein (DUF2232)